MEFTITAQEGNFGSFVHIRQKIRSVELIVCECWYAESEEVIQLQQELERAAKQLKDIIEASKGETCQ